eukprot:TRINITY_DN9541_c0_g1_i1.p1 TRINITY_DN9541_c0_g1~~TRINITY_DN9541_c0_g1_i1.p1  ORF type:complete len:235 (-),score=23.28 TRINITY_DN9541_c0_g1_i1:493-1197(-)
MSAAGFDATTREQQLQTEIVNWLEKEIPCLPIAVQQQAVAILRERCEFVEVPHFAVQVDEAPCYTFDSSIDIDTLMQLKSLVQNNMHIERRRAPDAPPPLWDHTEEARWQYNNEPKWENLHRKLQKPIEQAYQSCEETGGYDVPSKAGKTGRFSFATMTIGTSKRLRRVSVETANSIANASPSPTQKAEGRISKVELSSGNTLGPFDDPPSPNAKLVLQIPSGVEVDSIDPFSL